MRYASGDEADNEEESRYVDGDTQTQIREKSVKASNPVPTSPVYTPALHNKPKGKIEIFIRTL